MLSKSVLPTKIFIEKDWLRRTRGYIESAFLVKMDVNAPSIETLTEELAVPLVLDLGSIHLQTASAHLQTLHRYVHLLGGNKCSLSGSMTSCESNCQICHRTSESGTKLDPPVNFVVQGNQKEMNRATVIWWRQRPSFSARHKTL